MTIKQRLTAGIIVVLGICLLSVVLDVYTTSAFLGSIKEDIQQNVLVIAVESQPEKEALIKKIDNFNKLHAVTRTIFALCLLSFIIAVLAHKYKLLVVLNRLTVILKSIAEGGNLKSRIDLDSEDELGTMGAYFNKFIKLVGYILGEIKTSINHLNSTMEELRSVSFSSENKMSSISQAMDSVAQSALKQSDMVKEALINIENVGERLDDISEAADEQVKDLALTSDTITSATDAIGQYSSDTQKQVVQIHNASSIIEHMVLAIEHVATEAATVAENSQRAETAAREGENVVIRTMEGMSAIKDIVINASEKMSTLGSSMSRIGEIIQVIEDIAEQTNLLALNAAIEAARAGQHGRGFAVVAGEVRKLAERAGSETREIRELIKNIEAGTVKAISSIEEGSKKVQVGVVDAMHARESLRNIIIEVGSTALQIQSITAAGQQMFSASTEAMSAIKNVEKTIHKNSTAIMQIKNTSDDIVNSVNNLRQIAAIIQAATLEIKDNASVVVQNISDISTIGKNNSVVADDVYVSVQDMQGSITNLNGKVQNVFDMIEKLNIIIDNFTF